ncbi:MAG TPA: T9SS type A sorting domain-containing protein [Candidatus Kapabacteria bacterium]|nr:T9SS type A sorting domain-containing protein [Candidatus Kapabacteria bacterium]
MVTSSDPSRCVDTKVIYLFAGQGNSGLMTDSCEKLVIDGNSIRSLAQLHRESGASFFGDPDTLPLAIDVSSQINLDSLWPYIQTISGAYSWDSSVVNYEAYAPPAGWVTTSLSAFGDSVAFTIRKLSGSVTSPLSLGTGVFLPGTERLASTWVSLSMLTLQIGSETVPVCVSANEDSHWSVKVLGTDGVTSPPNETGVLSVQSVRFENGMILLAYHDSLINPRPLRADVFDILGRRVISEEIGYSSSPTILNQRLANGVYYIRLSDGHSTVFQRVMQSVP